MNYKYDQLILRKVLGSITREEELRLQNWIQNDPGARKRYEEFVTTWEKKARNAPEFSITPVRQPKVAPFRRRREEPVSERPVQRKLPAAPLPQPRDGKGGEPLPPRRSSRLTEGVAVTLVCLTSFFLFLGLKDYPELRRANGVNNTFFLSDSTEVTLKPGSAVKVSGHYMKESRTVFLYGDGHFLIRGSAKPFLVKTPGFEVSGGSGSVLINSANLDGDSEIMVLTGSVKVIPVGNSWRKVTISKGQKGVVDAQGKRVALTSFDTINALAWKEKTLIFSRTSMEEAIPTLEDYFNVRFELKNPDILNCKLSRTFRDPNIMEVTEALRRSIGVRVTRQPGLIILEGKGCRIGKGYKRK